MKEETSKDKSIEDLDSLLKGLKDNKEMIKVLNKLEELTQRVNMLEQRLSILSNPYPQTGQQLNGSGTSNPGPFGGTVTYGTTTGSVPFTFKIEDKPF